MGAVSIAGFAYSGDVLNTASRIQGLCNECEVDLLLSEPVVDVLPDRDQRILRRLREFSLRGRSGRMAPYTPSAARARADRPGAAPVVPSSEDG